MTTGIHNFISIICIQPLISLCCCFLFRNGYIFWADTRNRVYKAFLNGSSSSIYIDQGIISCAGMSMPNINKNSLQILIDDCYNLN